MQAQHSPFWTTPILAFCLSLIFTTVLAPTLGLVGYQQYDFWLIWLITMFIIALPLTILEIALAKRVLSTPLQGFMQLTRDADSSTKWRLISWATIIFIPFILGGILNFSAQQLSVQLQLPFSTQITVLLLIIIAVALSLIPRVILFAITLLATLAIAIIGFINIPTQNWQWTTFEFSEWAKVVVLSLITAGLTLGVYWQNALQNVKNQQKVMPIALPIWLAQILGLAIFTFVHGINSLAHAVPLLIASLALAGLLLQYVREQLIQRQLPLLVQAPILLIPALIWAIPQITSALYQMMIIWGLLLGLGYSIFAGWFIKISHLRKAINFSNEAIYNIWRIAVRIIIPLAIICAMIGWIMIFSSGV